MEIFIGILSFLISGIIFTFVGIYLRKSIAEKNIKSAEDEAQKIISEAKKEAKAIRRDEEVRIKEEALKLKMNIDEEIKSRREEVLVSEKRLMQKEESFERRVKAQNDKEKELDSYEKELIEREADVKELENEKKIELERVANLTTEEAKKELLEKLEQELVSEKAKAIKMNQEELKKNLDKEAKNILTNAIEKCAADHVSESSITVVMLPNDEMKGRIIGKEGRNVKTLEVLTGVQLIIDDTPEAITISGFDPVRREVARIALEKLMSDGRIHPAKIEEVVEKAIDEVENVVIEEGERAIFETGIKYLHEDLQRTLGKLKFRTSYGQNVLTHSIEVSNIARNMAEILGLDVELAARGGLLHDIGKALDHELNTVGTHVELGVELLKKYGEREEVINIVEAHHGDVEPKTLEAVLVKAADAVSASRPGARRDTFEQYIRRLESLEKIADSFEGVNKSYAIQAGREVRLIVDPKRISDDEMTILARDVSNKVENELAFPGQIKVTVIRELRSIDYAKQSKINRNIKLEEDFLENGRDKLGKLCSQETQDVAENIEIEEEKQEAKYNKKRKSFYKNKKKR